MPIHRGLAEKNEVDINVLGPENFLDHHLGIRESHITTQTTQWHSYLKIHSLYLFIPIDMSTPLSMSVSLSKSVSRYIEMSTSKL